MSSTRIRIRLLDLCRLALAGSHDTVLYCYLIGSIIRIIKLRRIARVNSYPDFTSNLKLIFVRYIKIKATLRGYNFSLKSIMHCNHRNYLIINSLIFIWNDFHYCGVQINAVFFNKCIDFIGLLIFEDYVSNKNHSNQRYHPG